MTPPAPPRISPVTGEPLPPRYVIVGTGTDVGKTTATCALLHLARQAGHRPLPYKLACTGIAPGQPSDLDRLVDAAALPGLLPTDITLFTSHAPLAPGLALTPDTFLGPGPHPTDLTPATRALDHLRALEQRFRPSLTLIEAAGGLYVPMPGGTWQLDWLRGLEATVLLVAHAGLGTINHCRLTLEALAGAGLPVAGLIFVHTTPRTDPSASTNPEVVTRATGIPILGVLPFCPSGEAAATPHLLGQALLAPWPAP